MTRRDNRRRRLAAALGSLLGALLLLVLPLTTATPRAAAARGWPSPRVSERSLDELLRTAEQRNTPGDWADCGWKILLYGGPLARQARFFERALELEPGAGGARIGAALSRIATGEPAAAAQLLLPLLQGPGEPSDRELAALLLVKASRSSSGWEAGLLEIAGSLDQDRSSFDPLIRDIVERLRPLALARLGREEEAWRRGTGNATISQWTVVGPIGKFPALDFREQHPPERSGLQNIDRALVRSTPPSLTPEGLVFIDQAPGRRGTYYLLTGLATSAPAEWLLAVEYPRSFQVLLDGNVLLDVDRRARAAPDLIRRRIQLAPGTHQLMLKLLHEAPEDTVRLRLHPAEPGAGEAPEPTFRIVPYPSAPHPSPPRDLGAYVPPCAALESDSPPSVENLPALLGRARWTAWIGDHVARRSLLAAALERFPDSALLHAWNADLHAYGARFLNWSKAQSKAQRESARAVELQPAFIPAWLRRAELAWLEDRKDDELAALLAALEHAPGDKAVHAELALAYNSRGWLMEAEREFRLTLELAPWDATLRKRFLDLCYKNDLGEAYRAGAVWTPAWPPPVALLPHLARAQGPEHALNIARKLSNALPRWPAARIQEIELLRLAGRDEEARSRCWNARATMPDNPRLIQLAAELEARADAPETMLSLLEEWSSLDPQASRIRHFLNLRDWDRLFSAFPVDVDALVREARNATAPADELMVFDQGIIILDHDGASMERFLVLKRILTRRGVEKNVDLREPGVLDPVRVQVIKPDGRRYDATPAGSAFILTNLEPGDFVLVEAYRITSGSQVRGTYISPYRFVFQDFQTPVLASEFTVLRPPDLAIRVSGVQLDTLNHRRRMIGAYLAETWSYRTEELPKAEPLMPPYWLVLPNLHLVYNFTWQDVADLHRERMLGRMRLGQDGEQLFERITGGRHGRMELERIHGWISEEITQDIELGGDGATAEQILQERRGDRVTLLLSALDHLGFPHALYLAQDAAAKGLFSTSPSLEAFTYPLIRVETDDGPVWLSPAETRAPFDYIPPQYRGGDALRIPDPLHGRGGEIVSLPNPTDDHERSSQRLRLRLDEQGNLQVAAEIQLTLADSMSLRQRMKMVGKELMKMLVQMFAARIHPGAVVEDWSWINLGNPTLPLGLRIDYRVPQFGKPTESGLETPRLLPDFDLARQLQLEQPRHYPLVIPLPIEETWSYDFQLPPQLRFGPLPPDREEQTPYGTFTIRRTPRDQGATIDVHIRIPIQRVEPDQVPGLRTFLEGLARALRNQPQILRAGQQ
jgi:Tfp pilus assembly protein PilF